MTSLWRAAALACVATALQIPSGQAADVGGETSIVTQGLSDVDIAIGRGDIPSGTSFGLKVFVQPLPGATVRDDLVGADGSAVRREFSFISETGEAELLDVVAAIRDDVDQPTDQEDAGAAVNEWTDMLDDSEATPALAPPARRGLREAPGRSPSGMGSQVAP